MLRAGLILGLTAAVADAAHAETPTVGVSVLAAEAGDSHELVVGGQLAIAWSVDRFTLTGEGSLLDLPDGAGSQGRARWLGVSGRIHVIQADYIADDRDAVLAFAIDGELIVQRESWRIDGAEPFRRTTWGVGIGTSIRVESLGLRRWVYDTRGFVRFFRDPLAPELRRETLVLFGFGLAFGTNTSR